MLKTQINYDYHINPISSSEILKKYNLTEVCSNDLTRLLNHLNIPTRSIKESLKILYRFNIPNTSEEQYRKDCAFKFKLNKNIKGYEKISNNKKKNNQYSRDHMISIAWGWHNNIPPEIISHPANCNIITCKENSIKGSQNSIEYNDLLKRIDDWNNEIFTDIKVKTFSKQQHLPETIEKMKRCKP